MSEMPEALKEVLKVEAKIIRNVFLNPKLAIEMLDERKSNARVAFYLLVTSIFFSLNFLYGTYIGNPSAYWFVALPFVVPYNVATLLSLFAILTLFATFFGSGSYPASNLFRNITVISLIPQTLLILVGLIIEFFSFLTKNFYVGVVSMEYGVLFATGLTAILSAYTLNRTKGVDERISLLLSTVLSTIFIIFSLLFFVYLFANRVYSV